MLSYQFDNQTRLCQVLATFCKVNVTGNLWFLFETTEVHLVFGGGDMRSLVRVNSCHCFDGLLHELGLSHV